MGKDKHIDQSILNEAKDAARGMGDDASSNVDDLRKDWQEQAKFALEHGNKDSWNSINTKWKDKFGKNDYLIIDGALVKGITFDDKWSFDQVEFRKSEIKECEFNKAEFNHCRIFEGTNFTYNHYNGLRLDNCSIRGGEPHSNISGNFKGFKIYNSEIVSTDIDGYFSVNKKDLDSYNIIYKSELLCSNICIANHEGAKDVDLKNQAELRLEKNKFSGVNVNDASLKSMPNQGEANIDDKNTCGNLGDPGRVTNYYVETEADKKAREEQDRDIARSQTAILSASNLGHSFFKFTVEGGPKNIAASGGVPFMSNLHLLSRKGEALNPSDLPNSYIVTAGLGGSRDKYDGVALNQLGVSVSGAFGVNNSTAATAGASFNDLTFSGGDFRHEQGAIGFEFGLKKYQGNFSFAANAETFLNSHKVQYQALPNGGNDMSEIIKMPMKFNGQIGYNFQSMIAPNAGAGIIEAFIGVHLNTEGNINYNNTTNKFGGKPSFTAGFNIGL